MTGADGIVMTGADGVQRKAGDGHCDDRCRWIGMTGPMHRDDSADAVRATGADVCVLLVAPRG